MENFNINTKQTYEIYEEFYDHNFYSGKIGEAKGTVLLRYISARLVKKDYTAIVVEHNRITFQTIISEANNN